MFRINLKRLTKNTLSNNNKNKSTVNLYSFGSGWSGQLGLGKEITEQYIPKSIEFNNNQKLSTNDIIKTGSYHTILVTNDNSKLYTWGQNNYGQLGIGNYIDQFKSIENKSFDNISDIKIENVECGAFHSIVSTSNNKTYSFGWNSRFQCGHVDDCLDKINAPKEIEFLNGKKIKAVSCGFDYTIVATHDNNGVYVFGMNDKGQCGIINSNNSSNTPIIPPIRIKELDGIKIKKITSGWGHSLLLTEDGELLSWGSNLHGQCGIGSKSILPEPINKVILPNGLKVLDISCGSCVSIAILSDYNLYIWGSSGDGKLGMGYKNQKDDLLLPTLLNPPIFNNNKINKVSFGSDHCIALSDTQKSIFYGWGFGQHGCLGFGDSINQLKVYSTPEINNYFNSNQFENQIITAQSSLDTTFLLVKSTNK